MQFGLKKLEGQTGGEQSGEIRLWIEDKD